MEDKIVRHCDAFLRAINFGKGNAADFPPDSNGAKRFVLLGNAYKELEKRGATQKGKSVSARNAAIHKMESDLSNITRAAHAIAQDVAGFNDLFHAPDHYNPNEVLQTARRFVGQLVASPEDDPETVSLKKDRVELICEQDLPATFATDLQADLTAVDNEERLYELDRQKGLGSTKAIANLVREGMKQMKYLDAIMHVKYKDQPDKLREWISASHVEHAPTHPKEPPTPPAPNP